MKRRDFLKKSGFGVAASMAVALVPLLAKEESTVIHHYQTESDRILHPSSGSKEPDWDKSEVTKDKDVTWTRIWEPNTRYEVGDRVAFPNGQVVELQMSGTSASVFSINGTILPLKGDY